MFSGISRVARPSSYEHNISDHSSQDIQITVLTIVQHQSRTMAGVSGNDPSDPLYVMLPSCSFPYLL